MAKCSACGKFLSSTGVATCTLCPSIFHKGCVVIPDGVVVPGDWVCPECKRKQRKGDNSDTPVKRACGAVAPPPTRKTVAAGSPATEAVLSPIVTPAPPLAAPPLAAPPIFEQDVRDMRHELAEYMAELREFRKEFRDTMASMRSRMDAFEQRLEAIELRKMPVNEVTELQLTVAQLKTELSDRDQEALLSDLDIGHLPEEKGENVQHVITVLAAKLGVALEARDVVFAERVGSVGASATSEGGGVGGRARRVVVRLARRHLRDDLLQAARVRRNFTTADIGLAGPPRRVYVNERLTKSNRLLFHRVREECRKRHWRYSWTKRGRIFARQSDGKQAYFIRSDADFDRVFGAENV